MGVIPLFPLDLVLVPGLVLPLHIFEPRYRLLVALLEELPEEERVFGIVASRPWGGLMSVGTTARITQMRPYDDGRYDISTTGVRRFRILDTEATEPYLQARVAWLGEPEGNRARERADGVRRLFEDYRACMGAEPAQLPDDPTVLSYLVSAALTVDVPEHQHLLEAEDTSSRLDAAASILRREISILRGGLPSLPAIGLVDEAVWGLN